MASHPGPDTSLPHRILRRDALAGGVIAAAILLTYANSFPGIFLLDDYSSILENRSIRALSHLGAVLSPPVDAGVGGRPFANLTFALNHAVGGSNPAGYHAVNVGLHLLATLTLFGVVRRTLALVNLGAASIQNPTPSAVAAALIWGVHPLATSAVNYASQRTELLMALFFLLTLYAFIRSVQGAAKLWTGVAVACAALGMMSKEGMATAPLAVLLYDRTFLAGTWRAALRQRRALYLGLASTWILLVGLLLTSRLSERGVGFGLGVSWFDYLLTQATAVMRYIQLAVWPNPLVFDYGRAFSTASLPALGALFGCVGLLAATLLALRRNSAVGFAGGLVALILAPSTSIVPIIQQPIAESRMYLPLAVIAAGVAIGVVTRLRRWAWCPLAGGIVALALATAHRNAEYRSEVVLWSDTTQKQPANARAHGNLSAALLRVGKVSEAEKAARDAIALLPAYPEAHHNLGLALARAGRLPEAIAQYETALRLAPHAPDTNHNLGEAWLRRGQLDRAADHFETAIRQRPTHVFAHNNLAVVRLQQGRAQAAAEHCRAALRLEPDLADAHYNLGNALAQLGDRAAAIQSYESALRSQPSLAKAHNNLGALRLQEGDTKTAREHFNAALRIDPAHASARKNLELLEQPRR